MRWRRKAVFILLGLLTGSAWTAARAGQTAAKEKEAKGDVAAGKRLFERHCALCHGIEGKGGRGPALNRAHLAHAPDDEALKAVISDGIPPRMPEGWFFSDEDIANVMAFVRSLSKVPADPLPGNAARGASVYAKSGCSSCHILNSEGQGFGPELTGIGEARSAAFLEQAIRKPAAVLPEDFLFVKATTASGEVVEGIRVNEDSFTIQIKTAGGRYFSLRKDELKDLAKLRGESPMPPFEGILSDADLHDLVAFLGGQKGKS